MINASQQLLQIINNDSRNREMEIIEIVGEKSVDWGGMVDQAAPLLPSPLIAERSSRDVKSESRVQ